MKVKIHNVVAGFLIIFLSPWPMTLAETRGAGSIPPAAQALDRLTEVAGSPPFQTTRIFDRHGNLLYELADRGRRTVVSLDQVPLILIQATIATEDKNFYLHEGVDVFAVTRALWQNLQAWEIVSGGSTIPQQLARLLLLDEKERYSQSVLRKVHEARLAMQLSQRYSKDEILEMYLNTVYYGHQAYGVAAAAEVYFNKPVSELTLAESALLAGLPQAPNQLDPYVNFDAARERQRQVLELMRRQGYITEAQMQAALAEEIHLASPQPAARRAPHFVDYVLDLLLERYGPEGMRQGLQVYTSIDLRYQELAEQIARAQIAEVGPRYNVSNAAVVILHPPTGQILAMVGSLDYYNEQISGQVNMAVQPRQPGSAIKPVLYAAAFENGWTPATVIWDTPVSYPLSGGRRYAPRNITGRFYGPLRLRAALANSLNVPAVKLLHALGVETMLTTARKMGITSWRGPATDYGLSLAVGGYGVTLLELTHAFATLANNGAYTPLVAVTEIRDSAGRVLFRAQPPNPPIYVISPVAAYQVTSILSDTRTRQMMFGRTSPLDTSQPTAVKTGTTDDWRDNWTVGYTPYLAVGVWLGNSNGKPMRDSYGFRVAGPIWHDIMEAIWATPSLHDSLGYAGKPLPQGFTPPPGIYTAPVCDLLPGNFNRTCPLAYEEVFALPEGSSQPVPSFSLADSSGQQLGYCLPVLQEEMPQSVRLAGAFVPLPRDPQDAAAARRWAAHFGLPLRRADECDLSPLTRPLAQLPPRPEPRRLVKIPEPTLATAETPAISAQATAQSEKRQEASVSVALTPGGRATLAQGIHSLNVRSKPGVGNPVRGRLLPGQIVEIRAGPHQVGRSPWFEVYVIESQLTGWVNGRYLQALASPEASTEP
jgi:1A family penicillin-binding protein